MADDEKTDHRKVYTKGFYDGIAAAKQGIFSLELKNTIAKENEPMRPAALEAKLNTLTSMMKKVYDAVPISEPWTIQQIRTEMIRKLGAAPNPPHLEGNLRTLVDRGIVKETVQGFKRAPCRVELKKVTTETKPAAPEPVKTPLQKLSDLAEKLRSIAAEVEDVALEVEELLGSGQEEAKKLKQLKELLSSIGN